MSELSQVLNAIADVKQQLGGVQASVTHLDSKIGDLKLDLAVAQGSLRAELGSHKADTALKFQDIEKNRNTAKGLWLAVKSTSAVIGFSATFVGILVGLSKLFAP